MIAALNDKNTNIRRKIAEALGNIKDNRAAQPLTAIWNNNEDDPLVRYEALKALWKITKKNDVLKSIINALKHQQYQIRVWAAETLGEIKETSSVNFLIESFKDNSYPVRKKAYWALGEIKDKRAIQYLIFALGDKEQSNRREAAKALVKIGEKAVKPLIALINFRYTKIDVIREAAWALGELKDERAIEPLVAFLKNGNICCRKEAADSLNKIIANNYCKVYDACTKYSE